MRLRTASVALFSLCALLLGTRPASAQTNPARLWLGISVIAPSGTVAFEGVVEGRAHEFHGSAMTIMAGGGIGGSKTGDAGAGLKWAWKLNDKCDYFAAFLAGVVWHPDPFGESTVAGFGMTPTGGITYKITDKFDFFATVGLGLLTHEGGMRVGTQISGGITMPLKH